MKRPVEPIVEQDLKALVSSTLRRQHLIGSLPGAQRFLPVAAFAAGDLLARKLGVKENLVEDLLCGNEDSRIRIRTPADKPVKLEQLPSYQSGSTIVGRCRTCSRPQQNFQYGTEHIISVKGQIGMVIGWNAMRRAVTAPP